MQSFRDLANLHDLAIMHLNFRLFPHGFREHFGHFSHLLRSVALLAPRGTRSQLLDFLRLFPGLDDIRICDYRGNGGGHGALEGRFEPIGKGLRGQLSLKNFRDEGLLRDIIVAFGGMRFTSMRLESVVGVPLLLEACANTLETAYIYPGDMFHPGKLILALRRDILGARLISRRQLPLHSSTSHATVSFGL